MSKILCFCPVVGDTKDAKRVEILQSAGYNVTVVAFERDYFISRLPNCEIITIGKIQNGKYVKRIFIMLLSLFRLRKIMKKFDIIYALSPDLAFMSYLATFSLKKIIIMDVADIREVQMAQTIFGRITRFLDKFIAERCELIVVTSEAFIKEYYLKRLKVKIKDYFLLENKVDYSYNISLELKISPNKDKIRIGYFGVLRDNWTIEFLLKLLTCYPDKFEIVVAGINMIDKFDINKLSETQKGFRYLGPFKSPDDLLELYNGIDMVALFYPEHLSSADWFDASKICRSNRYYEACFFKKPILAFSFSEDGKLVRKLDIGLTFDNYNILESISLVCNSIIEENILKWKNNLQRLPESSYFFKNEHLKLRSKIMKIISK